MPRRQPTAADWTLSYAADNIPWDLGRPHPELAARLAADPALGLDTIRDAVVPGCGLGHDAVALAEAGWTVTALDFADVSPGLDPPSRFVRTDALTWSEPADLWFDHTFFCAIPPDRREDWGATARRIVRPGGLLISLVFPACKTVNEGPPWPMSTDDVATALGAEFDLLVEEEAASAGRPWESRWAMFGRVT